MLKDTRSRNQYFNRKDIHKYVQEYAGAIAYGLNHVPNEALERAQLLLRQVLATEGRIFVGGNGGSAAIADHLCCDFGKGTVTHKHNNLIVHSLVSNGPVLTAIANDIGYEQSLSYQLELMNLTARDAVILISSSGGSPNIVKAAEFAHSRLAPVVGLTGFDGGELRKISTISLHVPVNNYGVIEDCHQALMHILAQFHYLSFHD